MLTYHSFTMVNIKFAMIFFVIVLEFLFISICRKYLLFKFSVRAMWYTVKNVVVTLFLILLRFFKVFLFCLQNILSNVKFCQVLIVNTEMVTNICMVGNLQFPTVKP